MKLNTLGHALPEMNTRRQPRAADGLECARSLVGPAGITIQLRARRVRNAMTPTLLLRHHAWKRTLGLVMLAGVLAACNRQGPDVPTAIDTNPAPKENPNGIGTVEVANDAAFIGSAIDDRGDLVTPQLEFTTGATVYVSVPSKGRKMGDQMEVFWFHDDGQSRKDETKKIEGPFTAFEFKPSEAGKYNVEVDVNNRPIALVEFEVK